MGLLSVYYHQFCHDLVLKHLKVEELGTLGAL